MIAQPVLEKLRLDDIPIIRSVESFEAFFQRDYRAILGLAVVLSGSRSVSRGHPDRVREWQYGSTRIVPGSQQDQQSYPQVAWSPDGEWVFFYIGATSAGTGQLIAYRPGDESAYRVAVDLDGPYYGMATGS